jgi:hypothetical protein
MKNFVAFIFNVDSLESLENYSEAKAIEKKWMSNSFWCIFNGFANTGRTFLKPIFDSDNESLQNYIDSYLKQISSKEFFYADSFEEANVLEPTSSAYSIDRAKGEEIPAKFGEFYNKYVEGRYDIAFEKFISIFQIKSKDQILKELKDQHKVLKKDGKKLIELFC